MPESAEAFRAELLRRLELLDREVRSLESGDSHDAFVHAIAPLGETRKELVKLLFQPSETDSWPSARVEIVELWSRYRREFEQLAAAWQRRYSIRLGQSERGPRW